MAREKWTLCPGSAWGHRHQLRRLFGRARAGESAGPVGRWREHRRVLQLDDRDDKRTRLSTAVRPTEDGPPGHGRRPVPQVLADLLLGQHPGAGPVHWWGARSSL